MRSGREVVIGNRFPIYSVRGISCGAIVCPAKQVFVKSQAVIGGKLTDYDRTSVKSLPMKVATNGTSISSGVSEDEFARVSKNSRLVCFRNIGPARSPTR
jgi:hypothetical protein